MLNENPPDDCDVTEADRELFDKPDQPEEKIMKHKKDYSLGDIKRLADKAEAWGKSKDGRRAIQKTIKDVAKMLAAVEETRRKEEEFFRQTGLLDEEICPPPSF